MPTLLKLTVTELKNKGPPTKQIENQVPLILQSHELISQGDHHYDNHCYQV